MFRNTHLSFPSLVVKELDSGYVFNYEFNYRKGSSISNNFSTVDTLYQIRKNSVNVITNIKDEYLVSNLYRGKISELYFENQKIVLRFYDFHRRGIVEVELE